MKCKFSQGYNPIFFQNPVVINNGFLPEKMPLNCLPNNSLLEYRLNELAKYIPQLLATGLLREEIEQLDKEFPDGLLEFDNYDEPQKNIAMLTLGILTQAYIWQEPSQPQNKIPRILAVNLLNLSQWLQRYPIITYADYILNNWQLIDTNKEISLENMKPIFTLTGTPDEAWFIKIHVMIEALCGKAVSAACYLSHLTNREGDSVSQRATFIRCLDDIAHSLQESILLVKRMKEGCNPLFFYKTLKRLLEGWEKVQCSSANGAVNVGVTFLGTEDANNKFFAYKGPSGAQSSIIPLIDCIVGVRHKINESFTTLLNFQQHMPKQHRALIYAVNGDKLRSMVEKTEDSNLKAAWLNAGKMLASFRLAHLALVEQFIFQPARAMGHDIPTTTGTGGSIPIIYLGDRYRRTCDTVLKAKL